jgi:tetratricopeptide (TPR) repeat protein
MDNVSSGLLDDNEVSSNAHGLYAIRSANVVLNANTLSHSINDGRFVNGSKNIVFIGNNASFNGGYGYNVTPENDKVQVNKNKNPAVGNIKGDYQLPPDQLSFTEISLVSLLIAFADKLIYLVDFQKIIMTNVFSGIVNPMREPLSGRLDRLSERIFSAIPVKRRGYRKAHVSSHMNSIFFHLINGRDIRGIVRPGAQGRLLSHEIVLQQIRFFDVLLKDRTMLFRNILYMAIMTLAGIVIYSLQASIGTSSWPYFLPLAIQFMVMFPVGLAVQGNVVGRVEKLEYGIRDGDSADLLRDDVRKKMAALDGRLGSKKVTAAKYAAEMKTLADALKAIDYMDTRRHYLLFTPGGYRFAISGFEALLEASPDEPLFLAGAAEAYAMRGRSLEMNGEDGRGSYEKSLVLAQKAYALGPDCFEARRSLARSNYYAGNLAEARKEAAAALRLRPGDPETYHILATMAVDPAEKLRLLQKAASANGSLPVVRRDLGAVLLESGDPDKAFALFQSALSANPSDPYAHYYLGRSYGMKGESQKAADEYRKALELYPDYKAARSDLAAEAAAIIKS